MSTTNWRSIKSPQLKGLLNCLILTGSLLLSTLSAGTIGNGETKNGTLSSMGDTGSWTIELTEAVTLRVGISVISGTDFQPQLRLISPDHTQVASNSGTNSTNLTYKATSSGTYTIEVHDYDNPADGVGSYQIYAAQSKGTYTVPSGDEGGLLNNGEFYDGTIDRADIDLWSISTGAGETIRLGISETNGSAFTPMLLLYGPQGNLLTSNSGTNSTEVAYTTSVAGSYTVIVQDYNSDVTGSGDYRLYFARTGSEYTVPSGDEGGLLNNGEFYEGTIDRADMDLWSLRADAGETIRLSISETNGSDLSPVLLLYGPEGNFITFNSGTNSTTISHVATVAGSYTVIVQDYDSDVTGSGDYRLYFARTGSEYTAPNDDEGGQLSSGQTYNGIIDRADIDLWTLEAASGDLVSISLSEVSTGSLHPLLILYGPGGEHITYDSDNTVSQINVNITQTGSYQVLIADGNSDATGEGAYQLTFTRTPNASSLPSLSNSGSIANGDYVNGSISTIEDQDKWSFSAIAGERIWVQVGEISGSGFNPKLRLYTPDGTLLDQDDGSLSAELEFLAPSSGSYSIVVSESDADSTGSYRLYLAQSKDAFTTPTNDEGGPLLNGNSKEGNITIGDIDIWQFSAQQNEPVWLQLGELSGSGFNPHLTVYDESGAKVTSDTGSDSAGVFFKAPTSGTYRAIIREADTDSSGSYRLHLASGIDAFTIPADDEGGSVINGSNEEGNITLGDIDIWQFSVEQNTPVWLQLGELSGSGFNPHLTVYDESGATVISDTGSNSASVFFKAPTSGTYRAIIRELDTDSSGSYRLHLAASAQPFYPLSQDEGGGLASDQAVSGTLTLGDIDQWGFHASQGDQINIQLTETNGSGFNPFIAIFGPNAILVAVASGSDHASLDFEASAEGRYTIVIRESDADSSGNYELIATGMTPESVELQLNAFNNEDNALHITWPSPSKGWILQELVNLETDNWETSSLSPVDNGFEMSIEIDTSESDSAFYRLIKP